MNWIILGIAISLNALANILIKVGVRDKVGKIDLGMVFRVITTPAIIGGILSFIFCFSCLWIYSIENES